MASDENLKQKLYSRKEDIEHRPKPEPKSTSQTSSGGTAADDDDDEVLDPDNIIPDDPLFNGFGSEGIGNMPELTALLQDDEILQKFQDETTTAYLRKIALDTSTIESVLETPEIKFLVGKIQAQFDKTKAEKERAAQLAEERAKDPNYILSFQKKSS